MSEQRAVENNMTAKDQAMADPAKVSPGSRMTMITRLQNRVIQLQGMINVIEGKSGMEGMLIPPHLDGDKAFEEFGQYDDELRHKYERLLIKVGSDNSSEREDGERIDALVKQVDSLNKEVEKLESDLASVTGGTGKPANPPESDGGEGDGGEGDGGEGDGGEGDGPPKIGS